VAVDPAATVYGNALYEAAEPTGRSLAIVHDLEAIRDAIAGSPEASRILFNPAFPPEGKKEILLELSEGADPVARNVLQVLVDHGRLPAMSDTIDHFATRVRAAEQQLEVELTTAVPVADAEADRLRARLAEASGKAVNLTRRVDSAVLGGIVLRIGDQLIDASVRGRLDGLRVQLRQARIASGGPA
jgi:F-type H+-transporting ATPase subunit delta